MDAWSMAEILWHAFMSSYYWVEPGEPHTDRVNGDCVYRYTCGNTTDHSVIVVYNSYYKKKKKFTPLGWNMADSDSHANEEDSRNRNRRVADRQQRKAETGLLV